MSDEAERLAERKAQEQREADLVQLRISELREEPIRGNFDAEHLKAVHAHIFQDFPEHQPGVVRDNTADSWIKNRVLEGRSNGYPVYYVSQDVEDRITGVLERFSGAESLKGLSTDAAAGRLAQLYGDLDHAHGFYEGNSRTLREFTHQLASEAGYDLDWGKTAIGAKERNQLYVARDLAVLERAFPELTPEKAMQTNDRAEYEASFVLEALRKQVGERSLEAIIHQSLNVENQVERGTEQDEIGSRQRRQDLGAAAPTKAADVAAAASPTADQSAAIGNAIAAGVGKIADGLASFAERGLDTVLSFLGGGSSAPEPTHEQSPPPPAQTHAERVKAYMEAERRQHAAKLQEDARKLGAGEAITEEELRRREMDAQKESRDRGGGISR